MRKNYFLMSFILGCVFFHPLKTFAGDIPFSINPTTDTILGFVTVTPPAMIWVVDSLGNITGADSTQSVNRVGEQTQNFPNGLYEIPNSRAVQENIEGDDGSVQPATTWDISIKTTAAQSYTLNVKGITSGVSGVGIDGLFPNDKNIKHTKLFFLVDTGTLRQLQVDFNPGLKKITLKRIVGAGDLLSDVKTACQLNQITSTQACKRLEEKAEAIQDSLEDLHYEKAEELILVFLHSLGESRPDGCKDADDHNAITEQALTIIIEDAKALLAQVEKDEQSHHGNHDHDGNLRKL
jgi:hypothetical protein